MANSKALVHQLISCRAAIDAALILLQEDELQESPLLDDECPHPKSSRDNMTVLGGPIRWHCRDCGYNYVEGESDAES